MTLPGPCVICGGKDYDLSCGGPTICPKCDCGNFDAATVLSQAKEMVRIRAERQVLQRRIKRQRKALREQHKTLRLYKEMIENLVRQNTIDRSTAYRHAASMATNFWFGWNAAKAIRRWL